MAFDIAPVACRARPRSNHTRASPGCLATAARQAASRAGPRVVSFGRLDGGLRVKRRPLSMASLVARTAVTKSGGALSLAAGFCGSLFKHPGEALCTMPLVVG